MVCRGSKLLNAFQTIKQKIHYSFLVRSCLNLNISQKIFSILLLSFFALNLTFCNYFPPSTIAREGILIFPKTWKGEAVYLKGEWLALNGIRDYEDFLDKPEEVFLISIPSTGEAFAGKENRKTVTLLLHVELPSEIPINEVNSILTRKVWTAHKILINGHTVMENGRVGDSPATHIPRVKPKMGTFLYTKGFDIVIQISNFSYINQGMIEAPIFGNTPQVSALFYGKKFHDIIFMLVVGLFFIVNIGIFLSNTKDKSSLIYSFLLANTFFLIPVTASSDRLLLDLLPSTPYSVLVRIEFLAALCLVPLYMTFLSSLFPEELNPKWVKTSFKIKIILIIFSMIDLQMMFKLFFVFLAGDIAITVYSYYIMVLAVKNDRANSRLMLTGFIVVTFCFLNDVFFEFGFINSIQIALYGIVFMFLTHSTALVFRLRKTNMENEEYAINLQKSKEDLELRVEERTRAYRDAMEQVKDTNKLKDRFLSIVSHDIRSPLSGVSGSIGLLLADKDMDAKDQNEILANSKKSIDGLILMTSDILNYAKSQTIRIMPSYEIIQIQKLVEININKLKGLILEKKIIIDVDGDNNLQAKVDLNLLGIVLTNLISNSIKYTQKGGKISLSYGKEKNKIFIKIKDNGIGISSDRLNSVFDYELNRSTEGTNGEKGTGFGLPFSKEIIDSLNAEIFVESKLGEGTNFSIFLPDTKTNILILDDNPDYREKMKERLSSISLDSLLIEKEEAESALDQLAKLDVQYIFSDYQMPGMNGLEFAYHVRDRFPEKKIIISIVTSWSQRESLIFKELEEKAKSIGVDYILPKDQLEEDYEKILKGILI
jgi:signal transduction histidine kinase/CheY-like chemotaxis protein